MGEPEMLSVREAAKLMHLHPSTLVRWILQGRLRYAKPGKRYLLWRSDIEHLMRSQCSPGTDGEARQKQADVDAILRDAGIID